MLAKKLVEKVSLDSSPSGSPMSGSPSGSPKDGSPNLSRSGTPPSPVSELGAGVGKLSIGSAKSESKSSDGSKDTIYPEVDNTSEMTVLQRTVRDAYLKKDKSILRKFISDIKGIYDEAEELAEYVNQQDKYGNTALHTCYMMYERAHNQLVETFGRTRDAAALGEQTSHNAALAIMIKHNLVEAGLDPSKANKLGQTAFGLCIHGAIVITRLEEAIAKQSHTAGVAVTLSSQAQTARS